MGQQPPGGYPPQQPPSAPAPPPGAYGQPAEYGGYRPARPGSVTAAGVLLIILGAFAGLGGIFAIIGGVAGGQILSDFGGQFADFAGATAVIGIVIGLLVITYAVFKIISGVKVFALRNGWRIAGIVLCAIAALGWVIVLIGSFSGRETASIDPTTFEITTASAGPDIGGIIFSLLFLGANAVTLILLARAGEAFRR
jgi:hypothetical protein